MSEGVERKLISMEQIMLVLTRKPGEGFLIGDSVTIKIIEMKGGAIRIGIDAPPNLKIYRQEVYDRIRSENLGATQWDIADLESISKNLEMNQVKK